MFSNNIADEEDSSEQTRLLSSTIPDDPRNDNKISQCAEDGIVPSRVVLVSLLASLGLHMTAASSVWAYAYLFCEDSENCRDGEKSNYAGAVATATVLANLAGLMSLGFLEKLVNWDARAGLIVWLMCRATGVLGFALGVHLRSFLCVLSGQVLQGLASDNILHFSLNSIYAKASSPETVSILMGSSLACYMIGMAIGPASAGLLPSFEWSFFVAIGILIAAIFYILIFVSYRRTDGGEANERIATPIDDSSSNISESETKKPNRLMAVLSPARFFYNHPITILQGLSLFLYNVVQGYLINLIFIFASLQFQFTPTENGTLLSLIAVVAASYLLCSMFVVPRILLWFGVTSEEAQQQQPETSADDGEPHRTMNERPRKGRLFDLGAAGLSILIQAIAAAILSQSSHLYMAAAMIALGLAAPSFIKSYFVAMFSNGTQAVSALALMEISGGLMSPLVLGAWQASHPDGSAFYIASGILALALVCLVCGAYFQRRI